MAYYPFAQNKGAFYKLVSPTGVTATFNDPTDPNHVGFLSDITGLDSAEVRESSNDLVQADGGQHGDFYFGRRPIVMTVQVTGHATTLARDLKLDLIGRSSFAMRGDSVLSWKPITRTDNLVTNPGGEVSAAGWVGTGGLLTGTSTVAQSAAQFHSGSKSIGVTTPGGAVTQGARIPLGSINSGATVTAAVWVRTPVTQNFIVGLEDNTLGNGPATSSVSVTANTWTRINVTWTPTALSPNASLYVYALSGAAAQTFFIDDAIVSYGSATPTYFDGSTAGFYWQGTPNLSASADYVEMFTTVRRQQPIRVSGGWNKEVQIPLVSQYAPVFSVGTSVGSAASGSGVVLENRGSYPAYPILKVDGISANPQVAVTGAGAGTLKTTGLNITSGHWQQYDTLNHVAVDDLAASGNRYIDFANTLIWPYLATGSNTITLTGGGTLTVTMRDAWI